MIRPLGKRDGRAKFAYLLLAFLAACSSGSGTIATSSSSHLIFAVEPATTLDNRPLDPVVVVQIVDDQGNLVPSQANVSLVLHSASGATGSLNGQTTEVATGGQASFAGMAVAGPGSGYSLEASSSGMASVVSTTFTVAAPAVVVDSSVLHLISDSASRAQGQYTFVVLDGGTQLPSVGSIIEGSESGGFLRRITAVNQSGNTVTYQTAFASLSAIMQDDSIVAHVVFPAAAGIRESGNGTRGSRFVPASSSLGGVDCSSGTCTITSPIVLYGTADNGISITSGRLTVTGSGDVNVKFGAFGVVPSAAMASITSTVNFDATTQVSLNGSVGLNGSVPIGTIPGIPLGTTGGTLTVDLTLEWSIVPQGNTSMQFDWTSSASATVGAQWSRPFGWTPITAASYSFNPVLTLPSTPVPITLHLGVQLKPRIEFFGVAGGDVRLQPFGEGTVLVDFAQNTYATSCHSAVLLGMDLDASIFDLSLGSYTNEFTLGDTPWPVCAHAGAIVPGGEVQPPTVVTLAATNVTQSGFRVNGSVNPNGTATAVFFESGTDPALASFSATGSGNAGSDSVAAQWYSDFTGYGCGTTIYYRVAASTAAGTFRGTIQSVTTLPCGGARIFATSIGGTLAVQTAPSNLYRIEASSTGVDQLIGLVRTAQNFEPAITDVAVDPNGRTWAASYDRLYTVDTLTGLATDIGPLNVSDMVGLTFSPTGVLYGLTGASGLLEQINTATGNATVVGPLGGGLVGDGDLAFSPDGRLYATLIQGGGSIVLATVSTSTGAATLVDPTVSVGYTNVWGLAFVDGSLFGLTTDTIGSGSLIQLDPATGHGTFVRALSFSAGGASARRSAPHPIAVTGVRP